MENSPFGAGHLPSQALVVLSEAASGLHEALRNQRSFQPRLPDVKDLHNMSLVGNYGSHLLHNFHPHLLQSLNPNMLSNGNPNNFFATDRTISKPILSSFQIPSAFSPPKYIGISLEQNLFNGNESFRTDSTSPISVSPLTKNDSLEGQSEYETDKGESPRSNPDTRDFRHVHIKSNPSRSPMTDCCPVCGIQLTMEEWNTHFLTELDRLYKLSSGMDRSNLQSNFMFGQCSNTDSSLRSSHNRWETFQRIRNNRQNRLRIKVRKRKCSSDLYVLENLFCNSCPVCRRKFPSEGVKNPEESRQIKDEIETVDVESCCDDVPDSGSDIHSTNKVEGVLYKSVCLINKETAEDVSNSWDSISNFNNKTGNELSSTTTQFYNADSCGDRNFKENETIASNNESDEDVVVDDDTVKICRKRKFDDELSSRSGNNSPEDGQQSEAQVTSTEQPDTSNKYSPFEERTTNLPETECQNFKVGKEDDYKCFICKKGLENRSNFFRGRTVYFHQDCANVMSSCRLGKVNN